MIDTHKRWIEGTELLERFPFGPDGAHQELARFVRRNVLSRSDHPDLHTSLLILRTQGIGAHLQLAAGHDNSGNPGIIWRTGTRAPYVKGNAIGLVSTFVSDPLLQRASCLPMTIEAALEDVLQCLGDASPGFGAGLAGLSELAAAVRVVQQLEAMEAATFFSQWRTLVKEKGGPGIQDARASSAWKQTLYDVLQQAVAASSPEDTGQAPFDPEEFEHIRTNERSALGDLLDTFFGKAGDPLPETIAGWLANHRPFLAARTPDDDPKLNEDRLAFLTQLQAVFASPHRPRAHLSEGRFRQIRGVTDETAIVLQGAGDLTFNQWNVAFLSEPTPRTIFPEGELTSMRHYRCLVSLKESERGYLDLLKEVLEDHPDVGCVLEDRGAPQKLAFLDLEFVANKPWVQLTGDAGRDWREKLTRRGFQGSLHDLIAFAISGKSVIWNGTSVPKYEVVQQFQDVRHLFDLCNLNPTKNRELFGRVQRGDVWLLEAALLRNPTLAQLATEAPISVPLEELGASQDWISERLKSNYRRVDGPVRRRGEYRWVSEIHPHLNIFLLPASYPCSIVGAGAFPEDDGGRGLVSQPKQMQDGLFLLAWGHAFERGRYAIWEDCGRILLSLGVRYALVMDEGQDVFQLVLENKRRLQDFEHAESHLKPLDEFFRVPLAYGPDTLHRRRGMRATLAFVQHGWSR